MKAWGALTALILLPTAGLSAGGKSQGAEAAMRRPLRVAEQGAFYVGGHYEPTDRGLLMAGQIYVEYQIPARRRHVLPIVMIHGHGQSGLNYISTPDGRPGWRDYFVRRGYTVYIIDQAGRGRSPWHEAIDGALEPFSVERTEQTFTHPEDGPQWPAAARHDQWPGAGTRGDPAFDQFYASQLESSANNARLDALNRDAGAALLDRIGPAILITHSRGGAIGWLLADARPGKVRAIVALEPWGPPFRDSIPKPPVLNRPWGLTAAPLRYEPAADDPSALDPKPVLNPDDPDHPCLLPSPPRRLPGLAAIPIAVVSGQASHHIYYDGCTVAFLRATGARAVQIKLADEGVRGNAHMLMIERNSDAVAGVVERWIARNAR